MTTDNPYRPPTAELRDPSLASSGPPPLAVRTACALVLASLAFGVLTMLPDGRAADSSPPGEFIAGAVAYALFAALTLWLTRRTWQGRRWARRALLVYLAVGWALYVLTLGDEMAAAPMAALVNTVCFTMELAGCGLLFFGAGARWFATVRSS